ncbi:hypothetical protein JCM11641_002550 [Rhodosporidiobolus odoratus]
MVNWAGTFASISAVFRPSILQPRLSIPSIANLDWKQLQTKGGITGVVIDKDNCIAKPGQDSLAPDPQLRHSWEQLLQTFGSENVLVVSNSAGTLAKDPLLLQAENVSRNLRVPVLVHKAPKPGHACVRQVAAHFLLPRPHTSASTPILSSLPAQPHQQAHTGQIVFSPLARALSPPPSSPSTTKAPRPRAPRLLVIGDRLATDMILSHRLSRLPLPLSLPSESPIPINRRQRILAFFRRAARIEVGRKGDRIETVAVLTTRLHAREGFGTTVLRTVEKTALWALQRSRRGPRASPGRVNGTAGTKLDGAEGQTVEDIEWERLIISSDAPAATTVPFKPATPPALEARSSRPSATFPGASPAVTASPSPPVPFLQRLQALPTTLSTFPSTLQTWAASLPPRLLTSLRRATRRASLDAQTRLPRLLASLHSPLSRLISIYTQPSSLVSPSTVPRLHSAAKQAETASFGDLTVRAAEKAVEKVEGVWGKVEGNLRGVRALAQARAEEVGRLKKGLGLQGLGGRKGDKRLKREEV